MARAKATSVPASSLFHVRSAQASGFSSPNNRTLGPKTGLRNTGSSARQRGFGDQFGKEPLGRYSHHPSADLSNCLDYAHLCDAEIELQGEDVRVPYSLWQRTHVGTEIELLEGRDRLGATWACVIN